MTPAETKKNYRLQCRQARQSLSSDIIKDYSAQITQHLLTTKAFQEASCVASYLPINKEVDTHLIHDICWKNNKTLLLPCVEKDNTVAFTHYLPHTPLVKNQYGIAEPETSKSTPYISHKDIDCLLVPLVGFDEAGNRIGYGGGYYDRYLQNKTLTTSCIGLAFEIQKTPPMHKEKWDISMDMVITEEKIYSSTR